MMSKTLGVCLLLIGVQTIYIAATDLNASIEANNGTAMPGLVSSNPETGEHITEDSDTHQIQEYAYRDVDCYCRPKICQCCMDADIKYMPNSKACVELVYLSNIGSMNATITFNKKDLMSKTFSVKNPEPLCADIPYVPDGHICARFYGIALSGPYSSKACVIEEVWLYGTTVHNTRFNCFQLGSSTVDDDDDY